MRISKERAENIATAITKPMRDNIEAAHKSLNEKGKEIIQAAVPKEIMTLFKKHPNHFKTNSSVRFTGDGIVRDIPVAFGCALPFYKYEFQLSPADAKEIVKLNDAVESLKDKYDQSLRRLVNTLIGLGTYKRIIEQLPEVEAYLPPATNTSLALPIKEVRKEIKELTAA